MKTIIWVILLAIPFSLSAQDEDKSYNMVETIYLDGNNSKLDELAAGLKAHNKKYHNKAPHEAIVWAVRTGPRAGSLVWMKGPLTFSDLDAQEDEDHGKDWRDNIVKNCTSTGPAEYWRMDEELTRNTEKQQPIVRVRFLTVDEENRQGYRINGLLKQLSETVKSLDGDFFWGVYNNQFRQGDLGRHYAIVTGFDKWGELDEDVQFVKAFEKIHGEGSFEVFRRGMAETFSNAVDEFWTLIPEFSGSEN